MVLIGFEVDPSLKREIEKKAKSTGISLSEFCRRAISKDLGRDDRYLTYKEIVALIDEKLCNLELKPDLNLIQTASSESPTMDPILEKALELILNKLEMGEEPLVSEISEEVGANSRTLGMLLSLHDIKSTSVHRDGKKSRRYLSSEKDKIKQILSH